AAVQEPGATGGSVLRRRAHRRDHQPAGRALGAAGDQPAQRRPVPREHPVGADDRGGAGGGLRAGRERALGAGQRGGGAAAGDGGADPGGGRVTRRRIRVGEDSPLWAATYEAALGEVFRLQSEIAERVTVALDVALRA